MPDNKIAIVTEHANTVDFLYNDIGIFLLVSEDLVVSI